MGALTCDSEGNCMLKDKLGSVSGSIGKFSAGAKWADNSLTCDSEGNCMLKDKLATNALTCDSEGNCMLKDKLFKMPKISASGSYGGVSGSFSTADNALTCD